MNITEKLFQYLDIFRFDPKWDTKNGFQKIMKGPIIPLLITGLFVAMAGVIIMRYFGIALWRHDSFHYTLDSSWYEGNLSGEGRWINYYLFDVIKAIPGHLAAIIGMTSLFLYGFLATSTLIKDKYLRIIFGLSLLMLPVVHSQNMWPNITMVPCLALLGFYFLSKKVHSFILFGIAAIFFFGTLSHFYFLIPLIYLGDVNNSLTGEFKHDIKYVFGKVLIPYALCFIVGFLAANAVVMLKTGGAIALGEWRKPTPANDLNQLQANFSKVNQSIVRFCTKVFTEIPMLISIGISAMVLFSLDRKKIWILLIILAMFLSPFYTTLYHGVFISDRTLMTAAIPLVAIFLLQPALKLEFNILHLLLCLCFIFPMFQTSANQLQIFGKIGSYYKHYIKTATAAAPPESINEAVVLMTNPEISQVNNQIKKYYNSEFKWSEGLGAVNRTGVIGLRSLGYNNVFWVNDKKIIDDIKNQIQNDTRKDPFLIISLNNKPNSFGLIMNNAIVDTAILDAL